VAVAAMRAENHIALPQLGTHSHRDGFLSDVSVARPLDKPELVGFRQALLTQTYQEHLPVVFDQTGLSGIRLEHGH
jgi:hypothetical protein